MTCNRILIRIKNPEEPDAIFTVLRNNKKLTGQAGRPSFLIFVKNMCGPELSHNQFIRRSPQPCMHEFLPY